VRRRRSRGGTTEEPRFHYVFIANERVRPRRGRAIVVIVAVVVVLAAAAAGAGLYWQNRPEKIHLSVTERRQLRIWMAIHNPDFGRLADALGKVGSATGNVDVKSTRPDPSMIAACRELRTRTDALKASSPVPVAALQAHLAGALDSYVVASDRCRVAGERGAARSLTLLQQSHDALVTGGDEMGTLQRLINRAVDQ
jgi:hypothetical protein